MVMTCNRSTVTKHHNRNIICYFVQRFDEHNLCLNELYAGDDDNLLSLAQIWQTYKYIFAYFGMRTPKNLCNEIFILFIIANVNIVIITDEYIQFHAL